MNFRKLRRKLSAILCSAMMVGGSGISNHVAMAGGIEISGDMSKITRYGDMVISKDELSAWVTAFQACCAESDSKIVLGNDNKSKKFSGYVCEFDIAHENKKAKVGLYFLKDVNGFAISINWDNKDIKFGVLPFSYFVYLMKKFKIDIQEFNVSNEMGEKVKPSFVDAIAYGFLSDAKEPPDSYDSACEWFIGCLEYVKLDVEGFDESEHSDNNEDENGVEPISVCCLKAFKKADPKWDNGESVFPPPPPVKPSNTETTDNEESLIPSPDPAPTKKGFNPWWLLLPGIPIVGGAGAITVELVKKYKKNNSKMNDNQKEISNKTFLGKKRRRKQVADKTNKTVNSIPNQKKYTGQFEKGGFKQLKKTGKNIKPKKGITGSADK